MEEKEEDAELLPQTQRGLRHPQKGIYEQLLVKRLITSSLTTDSLKIIFNFCNAAMLTEPNKLENVDFEQLKNIFSVALAFQQKQQYKSKYKNEKG